MDRRRGERITFKRRTDVKTRRQTSVEEDKKRQNSGDVQTERRRDKFWRQADGAKNLRRRTDV